jgi:uncharacterized protein
VVSKAAEQGNADAQYCLGEMYETGRGVERNEVEAVKCYQLSAKQDYEPAQNNLKRLNQTW